MIRPVILAGGSGTRLWPVSRKKFPKQFTTLIGDASLFQNTLRRFSGPDYAAPVVLTGEDYRFIAQAQIANVGVEDATIVIEPTPKNTAAAVLTAALMYKDDPDTVLLIAPSDHSFTDEAAFQTSVLHAHNAALGGAIVALGTQPHFPSTGFGYLKVEGGNETTVIASDFLEKPSLECAKDMLGEGGWLWSCGIFVGRPAVFMRAFEQHAADLIPACEAALASGSYDIGFQRLGAEAFNGLRDVSFDHAVMENIRECLAVEIDCGWSDLGSWSAISETEPEDEHGNVQSGNVTSVDCTNSLLKSEAQNIKLVGLGLNNIVAVATDDGILVADSTKGDEVGRAVELMRAQGDLQADGFRKCYRPWGYYETLSLGGRFQVKRIVVNPGEKLSLQSHVHRAEHWVVVEGSAMVTVDDDVRLLSENQSTYIPLGAVHRLENPGKLPLHLIEVQSGCYLGEDDIERYEDVYDRIAAE